MLWSVPALTHLPQWEEIRKRRQRRNVVMKEWGVGARGLSSSSRTGSPHIKTRCSQAPEKWSALRIELKVWMVYLAGSSIIKSNARWLRCEAGQSDPSGGVQVTCACWINNQCLCVLHCAKGKLGNGRLSASWRRFMGGSLKKSVVCGNHSDVPAGSKQPPCQDRPPLWFVYTESFSRQHGTLHT